MEITINKENIFKAVAMNVSIIARSLLDSDGNSLYDKVVIQERDNDVLESFWEYSFGNILKVLNDFIASVSENSITLVENRRFNDAMVKDLPFDVNNYIVNTMTGEWLKLKATEYAGIYSGNAELNIQSISEKIRYKTEPILKKFGG